MHHDVAGLRNNFVTSFPHRTPVIMAYDVGASIDAAMKAIDYAGFGARKAKAKGEGKLRGIGLSLALGATVKTNKRSIAATQVSFPIPLKAATRRCAIRPRASR